MRYCVACPVCKVEVSFVRLAGLRLPNQPKADPVEVCPNGHGFHWEYPGPGRPAGTVVRLAVPPPAA